MDVAGFTVNYQPRDYLGDEAIHRTRPPAAHGKHGKGITTPVRIDHSGRPA